MEQGKDKGNVPTGDPLLWTSRVQVIVGMAGCVHEA